MITCPKCGNEVQEGASVCPACGMDLQDAAAPKKSLPEFDFHELTYVNLDYQPSDELMEMDIPAEESEPAEEKDLLVKKDLPGIGSFFGRFKKKKNLEEQEDAEMMDENSEQEKPEAQNPSDQDSPTGESEEVLGEDPVEESRPKKKKRKKKSPFKILKLLLSLVLLLAIVLGGAALFTKFASPLKAFEDKLDKGSYVEAASFYEEHKEEESFTEQADYIMQERIDAILAAYAQNESSPEEAAASLAEYKNFPSMELALVDATDYAFKLQQSKNNYVMGNEAFKNNQFLECLAYWGRVLEVDVNYTAVKEVLTEKESIFISNGLLECSQALAAGKVDYYADGIGILYKWFPLDKNVSKAYDQLTGNAKPEPDDPGIFDPSHSMNPEESEEPDAETPTKALLKITKIDASSPRSNGGINLFIDWTNTSDRVIESIEFLVQPFDEFGNEQSCFKNGHSIYSAHVNGPFEVGQGMDHNEDSYWPDAWFNSRISKVKLLRVDIHFSGDESVAIIEPEEIEALF